MDFNYNYNYAFAFEFECIIEVIAFLDNEKMLLVDLETHTSHGSLENFNNRAGQHGDDIDSNKSAEDRGKKLKR